MQLEVTRRQLALLYDSLEYAKAMDGDASAEEVKAYEELLAYLQGRLSA